MKVIYNDYGGSHSSVTAAAIHLGILSYDEKPTAKDLLEKVPHYDGLSPKDHGRIIYRGTDEMGNDVFTMGAASAQKVAIQAIIDTTQIWRGDTKELFFINTMPTVNIWMMIGGAMSRALNIVSVGRPIVIRGTMMAYPKIAQLVRSKKLEIASRLGK